MRRLQQDDRSDLLRDLANMGRSGIAENENPATFRQTFYPVAEHSRAFDPDVALVIGSRGAGKSELFRAVVREKLLPAISRSDRESVVWGKRGALGWRRLPA